MSFGIILDRTKFYSNIGTMMRSCYNLEADFIAIIGKRFSRRNERGDTVDTQQTIPTFTFDSIDTALAALPRWPLVAVEITSRSRDLKNFVHPKSCSYVFGPEDRDWET